MFIGIQDIANLFSDLPSRLIESVPHICLVSYMPENVLPEPYSMHCLYIVSDITQIRRPLQDTMNFLIPVTSLEHVNEQSELLPNCNILFLQTDQIPSVTEKIQTLFFDSCALALFSNTLLHTLSDNVSIQKIIDSCYPALENPIFVFDSAFCLIAVSEQAARETHYFDKMLDYRYLTETDFALINQLDSIHEKIKKSNTPVIFRHKELPYNQMACPLDTSKDLGHLLLCDTNRPFNALDQSLLMLLRDMILQQMKKDSFIRNNKGIKKEFFLRDILDGRFSSTESSENTRQTSQYLEHLYCLVIDTTRSTHTINTLHIRLQFEEKFADSQTLLYQNHILILLQFNNNVFLTEKHISIIKNICQKYALFAGLSNCFFDILALQEYYTQALQAIDLGSIQHKKPGLFCYKDYYLEHAMHDFSQTTSFQTFCHPKLKLLQEYDVKHHAHLAETLYTYLISERNIAVASAILQIHRNTCKQRLKHIDSLVTIEYENYKERQYLILSYELQK